MVILPLETTKSPSAIRLSTVNLGGSIPSIELIHSLTADFPSTDFSPNIVHLIFSAQYDKNPSVSPSANDVFIFSTICLFSSDIISPPLLIDQPWRCCLSPPPL